MKETIINEVEDNYQDHSQHNNYDEKCSECYKNVREFDGLEDNELRFCNNCSVPCSNLYCDKCQSEIENGSEYYK